MSREGALVKNTAIIAIGKICTQFVSFFLLPLYTGLLSTEEFGVVDLLNTLVSLLLPIITFQVEQAVFRELIELRGQEAEKTKIISSSFFSVCMQCFLCFLFFMAISPFVHNPYKFFLAVNVGTSVFSSLFLQIARGLGNYSNYAAGSFFSASSTIIFNVIFLVVMKLGVSGMMLGTLLGQITCILYLFFSLRLHRYFLPSAFSRVMVKKLWRYSVPLVPNAISWWVFNASDRLIVSLMLGLSSNGILSAASKFSGLYIGAYNIFNISWTESVSLHIGDKDAGNFFNQMLGRVLGLFLGMAAGIIACMPFVFPVMVNREYWSGYGLVPILMLASVCNVVVGLVSAIYVAKKNTRAIANTSIVSAVVNIVVHLGLIRFCGLYAAAFSTLISYGVMSIYRTHDINKRYLKIKINKQLVIKTIIVFAVVLPAYYVNQIYLNIFSLLIAAFYAWDINRNSLGFILKALKSKVGR